MFGRKRGGKMTYLVQVFKSDVYEIEVEADSEKDARSKVIDEITENGLDNLWHVDESFDFFELLTDTIG